MEKIKEKNDDKFNIFLSKMSEEKSKNNKKIILEIVEPIDESWTIYDICKKAPPVGWKDIFENAENELKDVSDLLAHEEKIGNKFFPLKKHLFRAFELTPLDKVRVVIFGQDPYPSLTKKGTPVAQGLSFSVDRFTPIPGSLNNIYKEIQSSVPGFNIPKHGDLTYWARQGVLLCNACLTLRPNSPGSHQDIWDGFIKQVVNAIVTKNKNCIFVLWGNKAKKIEKMLAGRGVILTGAHPSPMSAVKYGFFGCGHFKKINELLQSFNSPPIDWNL